MPVTNAKVSRDILHNHDAESILYNEGSPQAQVKCLLWS